MKRHFVVIIGHVQAFGGVFVVHAVGRVEVLEVLGVDLHGELVEHELGVVSFGVIGGVGVAGGLFGPLGPR